MLGPLEARYSILFCRRSRFHSLRHTLGLLLVRQGRLADALVWFRQAGEAEPHSAHYSYVHALAVSGAGDPGAALRLLREATRAIATTVKSYSHSPP